jgi:hypothetical protein
LKYEMMFRAKTSVMSSFQVWTPFVIVTKGAPGYSASRNPIGTSGSPISQGWRLYRRLRGWKHNLIDIWS